MAERQLSGTEAMNIVRTTPIVESLQSPRTRIRVCVLQDYRLARVRSHTPTTVVTDLGVFPRESIRPVPGGSNGTYQPDLETTLDKLHAHRRNVAAAAEHTDPMADRHAGVLYQLYQMGLMSIQTLQSELGITGRALVEEEAPTPSDDTQNMQDAITGAVAAMVSGREASGSSRRPAVAAEDRDEMTRLCAILGVTEDMLEDAISLHPRPQQREARRRAMQVPVMVRGNLQYAPAPEATAPQPTKPSQPTTMLVPGKKRKRRIG